MDINTQECSKKRNHRGPQWKDVEIKELLEVAVELNINDMFDSQRLTAIEIYGKMAEKYTKKDKKQIQIKMDALRRAYTNEKCISSKSGAGAPKKTIYDDLMLILWGSRRKFTVPKEYGQDTTDILLDPSEYVDVEENSNLNSTIEPGNDEYVSEFNSFIAEAPAKKKMKYSDKDWSDEFRVQQETALAHFQQLHEDSENRADDRTRLMLEGMQNIVSSLISRPAYQPPVPQPTIFSYQQPVHAFRPQAFLKTNDKGQLILTGAKSTITNSSTIYTPQPPLSSVQTIYTPPPTPSPSYNITNDFAGPSNTLPVPSVPSYPEKM